MDSRRLATSSLPCLSKDVTVSGNLPASNFHALHCNTYSMASEPVKLHLAGDVQVSETDVSRVCECASDEFVFMGEVPLLQASESQTSRECCYLCSQSGPIVKQKEPASQQSKRKTKPQSLISLSSSKSSYAPLAFLESCHSLFSKRDNTAERIESTKYGELNPRVKQESLKELTASSQSKEASQGMLSRLNESCGLMCRICHSGEEDEELIRPCRCTGTVKYAHQSCILSWVSKSGSEHCELCKYKFKTWKKKVKYCWKWSFPEVSTKGWLHIGLFIAFATMLLTSITWIVWSRISRAPTAVAERTTEEVKFAYMLNGLFIALALGGLYFDSYKHFRRYFKRWAVLNQHVVVEVYTGEERGSNKNRSGKLLHNSSSDTQSSTCIAVEMTERERNSSQQPEPSTWV